MSRKLVVIVSLAVLAAVAGADGRVSRAEGLLDGLSRVLGGADNIVGRVVLAEKPDEGVADVKVFSYPEDLGGRHIRATTDADGRFKDRLPGARSLVGAFNKDRSLGAIVRVEPDQKEVTLKLAPTTTVRGTIWDEDTSALAADRDVGVHIRIGPENGPFMHGFEQLTKTDDEGRFEVTGVVPGYDYEITVVTQRDGDDRPMGWRNVHSFKAEARGELDLGRMLLPKPYRPPTIEEHIAKAYSVEGAPDERLERAVTDARLNYLQVLVFVADLKSDAARQFIQMRHDQSSGPQNEMQDALYEYLLVAVDPEKAVRLLKQLSVAEPRDGEGVFAIVDVDGEIVAQASSSELSEEGKLSAELLAVYLAKHHLPLPNAREKLEDALQEAADQDKRVLVQVSGPGCGWCVVLARYLDEQKELVNKDYVWLKLDSRMAEADEVIEKLRKDRTGGIPWMTILDAKGAELITSDSVEEGNIGYPGEDASRKHFEIMLRATRQRLTDDDIAAMLRPLEDFARNREK